MNDRKNGATLQIHLYVHCIYVLTRLEIWRQHVSQYTITKVEPLLGLDHIWRSLRYMCISYRGLTLWYTCSTKCRKQGGAQVRVHILIDAIAHQGGAQEQRPQGATCMGTGLGGQTTS